MATMRASSFDLKKKVYSSLGWCNPCWSVRQRSFEAVPKCLELDERCSMHFMLRLRLFQSRVCRDTLSCGVVE